MRTLKSLFKNNQEWAAEVVDRDLKPFEELAKQQKPKYLACLPTSVAPTGVPNEICQSLVRHIDLTVPPIGSMSTKVLN